MLTEKLLEEGGKIFADALEALHQLLGGVYKISTKAIQMEIVARIVMEIGVSDKDSQVGNLVGLYFCFLKGQKLMLDCSRGSLALHFVLQIALCEKYGC